MIYLMEFLRKEIEILDYLFQKRFHKKNFDEKAKMKNDQNAINFQNGIQSNTIRNMKIHIQIS